MKASTLCLLLIATLLQSCGPKAHVRTRPFGDTARLEYAQSKRVDCELLAVDDSTLFVQFEKQLYRAKLTEFRKIHVKEYSAAQGKNAAMIGLVLIDGVVAFAGFESENTTLGVVYTAAAGLTLLTFLSGNPKVNFAPAEKPDQLSQLRLHCRYPEGLSRENWQALLQAAGQDDFLDLATVPGVAKK